MPKSRRRKKSEPPPPKPRISKRRVVAGAIGWALVGLFAVFMGRPERIAFVTTETPELWRLAVFLLLLSALSVLVSLAREWIRLKRRRTGFNGRD